MPLAGGQQHYAEVIVREWGEPDRYETVGPYSPSEPDDIAESEAVLEDALRRQGDDVVRVWTA